MALEVVEVSLDRLEDYAGVPISFQVESILKIDLVDSGLGGATLGEVPIKPAYLKDYDAGEERGPRRWPEKFDLAKFAFFLALDGDRPVGAAAAIWPFSGISGSVPTLCSSGTSTSKMGTKNWGQTPISKREIDV